MAGPKITTHGLQSRTAAASAIAKIQWAVATGSADVITATYDPVLTALTDGLAVRVRLSAPNLTTTPTFEPDDLGAHTIVKNFADPLEPGDLPDEAILTFDATAGRWNLTNPNAHFRVPSADWAIAGGVADVITATYDPKHGTLVDGEILLLQAGAANATTTPTFSPDTKTARTLKKLGGVALAIGDIYGAGHELVLMYHDSATPWFELLNPATAVDTGAFIELSADGSAGLDDASAQSTGLSVTLAAGTYQFRGQFHATRAAGTNSHTTASLIGGTATLTRIHGTVKARTGDAATAAGYSGLRFEVATAVVAKAASTSATEDIAMEIEGVVVVSVAGTFIWQYQFNTAPGSGSNGMATPKAGSFLSFTKKA